MMNAATSWRGAPVSLRVILLVSADREQSGRLQTALRAMRWTVVESGGGADAMLQVDDLHPEAMVIDDWLPDLEVTEFAKEMCASHAGMEVLHFDGAVAQGCSARSPRHNEILHAIRSAEDEAGPHVGGPRVAGPHVAGPLLAGPRLMAAPPGMAERTQVKEWQGVGGMVGESEPMREMARMIRLVAPRSVAVLIEGETGTGKELVAKAVHGLSARADKAFVVLNCAAIPEALLEAELFGHTRGAFTGAVQARKGRIEMADGGTLFLDEIGEMPLALQAKMLRFLEGGELQKVGENETVRVDVRVVAATHQRLEERAERGEFRLDLYHRLAVFPIEVVALRERTEDIPRLTEFFLEQIGREMPRKEIGADAMQVLMKHAWPGNVRELMHVLQRAAILCGDRSVIGVEDVRLRLRTRS